MIEPNFSRVPQNAVDNYRAFFEKTDPSKIEDYANGSNLTSLVALAHKVVFVIDKSNPIWDTHDGNPDGTLPSIPTANAARQWQLDATSEVKKRVASALEQKKLYYENNTWGTITKFFLKLFCMWNEGYTHAIVTAEDFLLFYDSRIPVCQNYEGLYQLRYFWPLIDADWIRRNLNTTNFYNYTPKRTIEFRGTVSELRPIPLPFKRVPWKN